LVNELELKKISHKRRARTLAKDYSGFLKNIVDEDGVIMDKERIWTGLFDSKSHDVMANDEVKKSENLQNLKIVQKSAKKVKDSSILFRKNQFFVSKTDFSYFSRATGVLR
jgi:hypothetical protein